MNKKNLKILIAGSNGIIGSFLNKQLSKENTLISLSKSGAHNEKTLFVVDLLKVNEVQDFVKNSPKFDVLIFLVGLAHKKGKKEELNSFRKVNKQTLINIMTEFEICRKIPSKIIFASTISIYGEKYRKKKYAENSKKTPLSPYAATKLEAEEFLFDKFIDRTWILRFSPVYSPKFLLNIERRTKLGKIYFRVGKGLQKLSLCNIQNIKSAIDGIIYDKVPVGVYNISDKKNYSYQNLLKYMGVRLFVLIPPLFIKLIYHLAKRLKILTFHENSIKLLTDNIYPSSKFTKYVDLPFDLK